MVKTYDKPIKIQKRDEITETWVDVFNLHAFINKGKNDDEYLSAGAIQGKRTLVFEVRYFKDLEDISYNTQLYRILYRGITYDIKDFDDFMLHHKTVKLLGVSY
jgi:SPP1 family predicted phage head-tail adaptor